MFKDILLVGVGSFVGGSLRMVISKYVQLAIAGSFPLGTMVVNVLGCFLIGIFASLPSDNGGISPAVRLLLTTGFCGGFPTFVHERKCRYNKRRRWFYHLRLVCFRLIGVRLSCRIGRQTARYQFTIDGLIPPFSSAPGVPSDGQKDDRGVSRYT